MKRTIFSNAYIVGLGLMLALGWSVSAVAQETAAKKKPSERTVRIIMGWAFAALPEKVKTKDGKEVTLDRSDPNKFIIPVDDARRVIRVALRSTNAGICGLRDLELKNFLKMMAKEKALGKWTPNQIRFIQRLHVAAGLVMTGDFSNKKSTEGGDDGKKDDPKKNSCSPEKQARVAAAVKAYLLTPDKAQ